MSTARWIDLVMGLLFVVLGVWGLVPAAGGMILGVLPMTTGLSIAALIAGAVLLFGAVSAEAAHGSAALMSVTFALVALLGLVSPTLFGLTVLNGWSIGLLAVSAALLFYDWLATPDTGLAR